jgi:hypothetical protein
LDVAQDEIAYGCFMTGCAGNCAELFKQLHGPKLRNKFCAPQAIPLVEMARSRLGKERRKIKFGN